MPGGGSGRGKGAAPAAQRTAKVRAKPKPKDKPKPFGGGTSKLRPRPGPKSTTKPASKPKARPKPKDKPKAGARLRAWSGLPWLKRSAAPKAGAGTKAKAAAAPEPEPPVLQRGSVPSLLARAAVLAVAMVCMVAFAVALARVTLVPSPSSDRLVHTNLRPGASIRAYLDQPAMRDTVKQIGGNVLLGVPFGILLPMLFPRTRGLLRVTAATALVMVMVEAAQGMIVEGRAFDIDDVILNTVGSLLGYLLLGRFLGRALHPRRRHWWHALGYGHPPRDP